MGRNSKLSKSPGTAHSKSQVQIPLFGRMQLRPRFLWNDHPDPRGRGHGGALECRPRSTSWTTTSLRLTTVTSRPLRTTPTQGHDHECAHCTTQYYRAAPQGPCSKVKVRSGRKSRRIDKNRVIGVAPMRTNVNSGEKYVLRAHARITSHSEAQLYHISGRFSTSSTYPDMPPISLNRHDHCHGTLAPHLYEVILA